MCLREGERERERKRLNFIQLNSIKVQNSIDYRQKLCVEQIKAHHLNADVENVINGVIIIIIQLML